MVKIYNSPYIVIIIYLFAIKLQNKREILSIVLHLSSKTIYSIVYFQHCIKLFIIAKIVCVNFLEYKVIQ